MLKKNLGLGLQFCYTQCTELEVALQVSPDTYKKVEWSYLELKPFLVTALFMTVGWWKGVKPSSFQNYSEGK